MASEEGILKGGAVKDKVMQNCAGPKNVLGVTGGLPQFNFFFFSWFRILMVLSAFK